MSSSLSWHQCIFWLDRLWEMLHYLHLSYWWKKCYESCLRGWMLPQMLFANGMAGINVYHKGVLQYSPHCCHRLLMISGLVGCPWIGLDETVSLCELSVRETCSFSWSVCVYVCVCVVSEGWESRKGKLFPLCRWSASSFCVWVWYVVCLHCAAWCAVTLLFLVVFTFVMIGITIVTCFDFRVTEVLVVE